MNIRNRIGISTLSLKGMSLDQAIDAAYEAEFHVFELVPHLYGGPEQIDQNMRASLRDGLGCFDTVTVHTSVAKLQDGRGTNITSSDKSYQDDCVEHYLEHSRLAMEVGAKLATFHVGRLDSGSLQDQMNNAHLTFAKTALEQTRDSDLLMGYEWFDTKLTGEIGNHRFGILFDIGHAALQSTDINSGIIQLMDETFPHIVQFHAHGVNVSDHGNKHDHQPLQANNGIDYAKVLRSIKGRKFQGPIIFEIQNSNASENLQNTVYAREEFIKLWEEC